jgi:thiamine-monophosphate kinase
MIDVSDGLALDLHRLADASEVGFRLDDVPVAEGATLDEALGGGEDYELVFAVSRSTLDDVVSSFGEAMLRSPVQIGVVVADPAERTFRGRALERLGWQHALG